MKKIILSITLLLCSAGLFAQNTVTAELFNGYAKNAFKSQYENFNGSMEDFVRSIADQENIQEALAFQFWVNSTQYSMTQILVEGGTKCTGSFTVGNVKNMCVFAYEDLIKVTYADIANSTYQPSNGYPYNYKPQDFTNGCFDEYFKNFDYPTYPIPLDGGLSFLLAGGLGLGIFRRFRNKK